MPELTEQEYKHFKLMEGTFVEGLSADLQRKQDAVDTATGQLIAAQERTKDVAFADEKPTEPVKG